MTSASPEGPRAAAPDPAGAAPALPGILLLLAIALLLAFGVVPFLPTAPAVPVALALFLLTGGRAGAAFRWGIGAVLAGSVLFFVAAGPGRDPGETAGPLAAGMQAAELAWLALIAAIAWRFGLPDRLKGPLLAAVVATSPFAFYPALAAAGLAWARSSGAQGSFGIVALLTLGGIAFSAAIALLLTAALVWAARKRGQRLAPMPALALVAGATLVFRAVALLLL